ncbi:MAG TPA: HGxxPAAW family protein [Actinomycetes bacterium]|nr:HGxxPAAW family protein [Actinomycetes bacterium]
MTDPHDDHGSTPAAWTAVTIIMVAFLVGGIGILLSQAWVFWVGVALVVVGLVAGKVMQMMGMGGPSEPALDVNAEDSSN